jgi:hypothetical protein
VHFVQCDYADDDVVVSRSTHTMTDANTERGSCRFKATQDADGKSIIRMEMFHQTVPSLAGMTLEFELLTGTTPDQARKLAESVNDRVIGVLITKLRLG